MAVFRGTGVVVFSFTTRDVATLTTVSLGGCALPFFLLMHLFYADVRQFPTASLCNASSQALGTNPYIGALLAILDDVTVAVEPADLAGAARARENPGYQGSVEEALAYIADAGICWVDRLVTTLPPPLKLEHPISSVPSSRLHSIRFHFIFMLTTRRNLWMLPSHCTKKGFCSRNHRVPALQNKRSYGKLERVGRAVGCRSGRRGGGFGPD